MIRLTKDGAKAILDDNELEFLAEAYLKLKQDKKYQKFSKTFQDYVSEFLEEELLAIRNIGRKDGK